MAHYSHTTFGGLRFTWGKRGVVFSRKPSKFNNCIADKMRGQSGSRESIKNAFTAAAKAC